MNNGLGLLGVILAGGQSRRMGKVDKHRISIGGKTLITHISDRLSPQVTELIINSNDKDDFDRFKVVPDKESSLGPIGGIYTTLSYALEKGYQKIITAPCDTPFIPDNFIEKLLEFQDKPCVIASSAGRIHPVLALWDVSIINDVKTSIGRGEYSLMRLIEKLDYIECKWQEKPDPFFNINTPDDILIAKDRFIS